MQPDGNGARLALVIGNGSYRSAPRLRNAINDARVVAAGLAALGFHVRTEFDLDGEHFQRAVGEFCHDIREAAGPDRKAKAVFYFAGHGVQVSGENYLMPVDGDIASEVDLKLRTVHLNVVIEALGATAETTVAFLDCCRENPLPRNLTDGRTRGFATQNGLASFDAPSGAFVAFATQPDNVAEDGDGDNSPFTAELAEFIGRADLPISDMMIHVRRNVHRRTGGRQIPWDRSALFEPFMFKPTGAASPVRQLSAEEIEEAREQDYWNLIGNSDSLDLLRSFVIQFPHGRYRAQAVQRIDQLRYKQVMRGVWMRASAALLAVVLALVGWYGQKWVRFTSLDGRLANADLVGGDLYLDTGHPAFGQQEPEWMCRFRCTMTYACIAYSFDTVKGTCYRKFEYAFYEDTLNKRDTSRSTTKVLRWSSLPEPRPQVFDMQWDRQLTGELVERSLVEADPAFKDAFDELKRNHKQFWKIDGAACQRRCADLGDKCRGFTIGLLYRHCQLFTRVTGIAAEPSGVELAFPLTITGCRAKGCREPKPAPAAAPAPAQPVAGAGNG